MNTRNLIAGLTLLAAGIAAGWGLSNWRSNAASHDSASPERVGPAAKGERKVLYWYDPMSPTQRFDKPGKSPFMDMQLQPKYADESTEQTPGLNVSAQAVQSLGLRVAAVQERPIAARVDAVGTVQLNEREVSIVQARAGGFVERVYARAPGDVIAAGAPLVDLLLPEWVAAQHEYLAVKALGDAALTQAARQRLLLLGMSEVLVARLDQTREPNARITVTAPQGGLIAELMVRQGMTVGAGMSLARINGLSSVWVEVAVPESQGGRVAVGQKAEMRFAAYGAEVFKARVVSILPESSKDTRTLRVRIELPNPGQRFKAGMFAQVSLQGAPQTRLLVPSEAVIRTGKRALAYVVDGPGHFHPVRVEVGEEIEDQLVVLGGLSAGQQVVASAQFLIDSEASLKGVIPPMEAASASPQASYSALGTIEEISKDEITLSHSAIEALKWPAMTMGFKLDKPALATGLKARQAVKFSFAKRGDDYVVVSIEPVARAASGAQR
ncbi:efflux RND transporter periplasmic adaptor subunit [Mitsuaria sp. WAJ17]|uniref:efflux RND transporter periplasmic adaptor subunit n=1 Tax=Mitsuaria sp. WAJ17 TaxID=2761452 RepID=UPI0015FFB7FE|nr:efflux RND transporter periplasmic adaptor subunit [Mitsuaria sp. WAJ17]MBB2487466.1 efflux RND transporter periplasmic adaptor subunit [Mitsuaria sp. WAJ17]